MFKIAPVQCALTNQPIASSSARISPYSSFFLLSQLLVPCKYLKDSIPLWLSKIIHVNIDIFHHTTYVKIIKFLLVREFLSFYSSAGWQMNISFCQPEKKITFNICPYKSFPNIANSSIIQRIKEVILIDPHRKTANHK